jgi:hypothetical protein
VTPAVGGGDSLNKQIKPNVSEADLNNQQLTCPIYCCGGTPGATLCCPFTTTITNSRTSRKQTFEFVKLPVNKIQKELC